MTQEQEKSRVLWQGIWQLQIAVPIAVSLVIGLRASDKKWENGMSSLWLRLERISVEGGHIVANSQLMQPIEFVQHKAGSKALSIPIGEIFINLPGFSDKTAPGAIKAAVVMEIMHANFEAIGSKFLA